LRRDTEELEVLLAESENAKKRIREAEEQDRELKQAIRLKRAKIQRNPFSHSGFNPWG
jgi:hypothetical protein